MTQTANADAPQRPTREELFTSLWERPATEVARELGISDVALGKLCRRLQVPKPPRGYWARVKAGRIPRRPALEAFREETELSRKRGRNGSGSDNSVLVKLSALQRECLKRALRELSAGGVDSSCCHLTYEGIRTISPDLAARILILIQASYERWQQEDEKGVRHRAAGYQSISGLVGKLLPLAKEQVLILQPDVEPHQVYSREPDRAIIIRLTAELQQEIGALYRLAKANNLAYVARNLQTSEHAWRVRYFHAAECYASATSELCISATAIWVRCRLQKYGSKQEFETKPLPIKDVVPVDILPRKLVELPPVVSRSSLKPYAKRLRALLDADQAYDLITDAFLEMDRGIPDERLALLDRLWFSGGEEGPFARARRAWDDMEADVEMWGQRLEREKADLTRQVLGVGAGDDVLVESQGQVIRMRLEGATVYLGEKDVIFNLWGNRYRKDGLPGKRQEHVVLRADNDMA